MNAKPRTMSRPGFTLIELIVSIVILTATLVALLRFGGVFAQANSVATARAVATRIAASRLEEARSTARYFMVERFVETNAVPTGFPDYRRTTTVQRVGGSDVGQLVDYKIITVEVTSNRLATPVVKTTAVRTY